MTIDAGGPALPNCGAAADPDAGRCPYCRARLATASCPSCFTLGFAGAADRHKCGTRRVRRRAEAPRSRVHRARRSCSWSRPGRWRCSNAVRATAYGRISGTVIDVCRGHDAFLDAGELHEIVSFRPARRPRTRQVATPGRDPRRGTAAAGPRAARTPGIPSGRIADDAQRLARTASLACWKWSGGIR